MSWTTKDVLITQLMRVEGDLVVDSEVVFAPVVPPPEPQTSTVSVETATASTSGTTTDTGT